MYLSESVAVDSVVPRDLKPKFEFPAYEKLSQNKDAFIDFWIYYLYKGLSSQTRKEVTNTVSDNLNHDVEKHLEECVTVSDEAFALLCIWNEWNQIEKFESIVQTQRKENNEQDQPILLTKELLDYKTNRDLSKYSSCVFKGSSEGNSNTSSLSVVTLGWNDEAITMYNSLLEKVNDDRVQKRLQRKNYLKEVFSKCNKNCKFSIGCSTQNKQAVLPVEHIPQVDGGKFVHHQLLYIRNFFHVLKLCC